MSAISARMRRSRSAEVLPAGLPAGRRDERGKDGSVTGAYDRAPRRSLIGRCGRPPCAPSAHGRSPRESRRSSRVLRIPSMARELVRSLLGRSRDDAGSPKRCRGGHAARVRQADLEWTGQGSEKVRARVLCARMGAGVRELRRVVKLRRNAPEPTTTAAAGPAAQSSRPCWADSSLAACVQAYETRLLSVAQSCSRLITCSAAKRNVQLSCWCNITY